MREEKRWLRHGKMATAFFFWLQNLCVLLVLLRPSKTPLRPYGNIPQLELQNIREPILNFTSHFGEINPDMLYLCRRGQSGLQRAVFASFPSVRRATMKKIVKSSIFCEKTSKFLSSLPFKTQTIDNQWEYDDASASDLFKILIINRQQIIQLE